MTHIRILWFGLLALLASLAVTAAAQDLPPRPDGPIYDGANVIAPGEKELLDRQLRDYNRTTGRAIIVATVPSLDGEEIELYAQRLAEAWGIGGKESENGLLFLVAPNDRKMRIHTARGLQERMTDIMSGRIIRNVVTPKFKQGDLSGGIADGVGAIIAQLNMDPAQVKAIEEAERARRKNDAAEAAPAIAGVIFWIIMIVFFAVVFGRRARGRRYRGGGGVGSAVGNVLMWTAINAAMNSGRSSGDSSWGGSSSSSSSGGFGGFGGGGGGGGGGGFGGFGGGGGGFNGGGASGSW